MSRNDRHPWQTTLRRYRWGLAAGATVTVLAIVRLCFVLFFSDWAYRSEIASDLAAWEQARGERVALEKNSGQKLVNAPPICGLRDINRIAQEIANGGDAGPFVHEVADFYTRIGPEHWSPREKEVIEPLLAASDKTSFVTDALSDMSSWLFDEANARSAVLYFGGEGGDIPYNGTGNLPLSVLPAVAHVWSERGQGSAAIDTFLTMLEAFTEIPRPIPAYELWSFYANARTVEWALITACGATALSDEQYERHERIWKNLLDNSIISDGVRTEAALMSDGHFAYATTGGPTLLSGFRIYAYGRNFKNGTPFNLYGFATKQQDLTYDINNAELAQDTAQSAIDILRMIRALRGAEAKTGEFPADESEVSFSTGSGRKPTGIAIVPGESAWTITVTGWNERPCTVIVTPIAHPNSK